MPFIEKVSWKYFRLWRRFVNAFMRYFHVYRMNHTGRYFTRAKNLINWEHLTIHRMTPWRDKVSDVNKKKFLYIFEILSMKRNKKCDCEHCSAKSKAVSLAFFQKAFRYYFQRDFLVNFLGQSFLLPFLLFRNFPSCSARHFPDHSWLRKKYK